MNRFLNSIKFDSSNALFVAAFGVLIVFSFFLGLATDQLILLAIPAVALLAYLCIVDVKKIYWLLIFCIPLSVEVPISTSLATDLPTEPLMVLFLILGLVLLLKEGAKWKASFLIHPLSLLILLHLGWTVATTIASDLFMVSFKFALAKTWYLVAFYFFAGYFIKTKEDFKKFLWVVLIPLTLATVVTIIRHSFFGFSFDKINSVTYPFFRNHVNYAATLVLVLPFVYLGRAWYPKGSTLRLLLGVLTLVFLVAIYLSYTRAAYLSVFIAIASFYIIKYKLVKHALLISAIAIGLVSYQLYEGNSYMHYAPEFEKAVTHTQFDNLVSATAKGEDISTMERVYRWVAGVFIVKSHPWMGVGPGNFYNFYQKYSLNAFATYVSDNPDRSSIHCYFLLMGVEQGIPGMIIFITLVACVLLYSEKLYHRTKDSQLKVFIMALILSFIVICALLLINDMIESVKVGSFFFLIIALIVNISIKVSQNSRSTYLNNS